MTINVDLIYPIGSIYLTTSSVSPQTLFGGTWEQITNDAYLKIASGSTAGNLGGTSSDHKIPVTSIPAHYHDFADSGRPLYWDSGLTAIAKYTAGSNGSIQYTWSARTKNTGGGQAYYPYYYDVFVWRRTA